MLAPRRAEAQWNDIAVATQARAQRAVRALQPVVCAVDRIGAGAGELVLINSDGMGAREYIGDPKSPVRWFVIGIVDE